MDMIKELEKVESCAKINVHRDMFNVSTSPLSQDFTIDQRNVLDVEWSKHVNGTDDSLDVSIFMNRLKQKYGRVL